MINAVTSNPEIFDPFVIVFIGGVVCTILGTGGGYRWGRNDARIESNKFWTMQNEIKAKNVQDRYEKKLKECEKGWGTRRRREVATIVTGTETDL